MNRLTCTVFSLAFLLGCDPKPPASQPDLMQSTADLTMPPPGDMKMPDLAAPPPMVMNPPNCAQAQVTATNVYDQVVSRRCAGKDCHANGGMIPPVMSTAQLLRTNTVGKPASADMNLITANDIHKSYLLYKLLNQQTNVPNGGGSQMPLNGQPLVMADLCLVINWIRSGAN